MRNLARKHEQARHVSEELGTVLAIEGADFEVAPAHNLLTTIVLTQGDDPGIMLGVASGMVMGPSRRLTGAFTCLVDGIPVQRLTSFGIQNSTNCPGVRIVPSQVKVLVMSP